jgi:hypothetical protein
MAQALSTRMSPYWTFYIDIVRRQREKNNWLRVIEGIVLILFSSFDTFQLF